LNLGPILVCGVQVSLFSAGREAESLKQAKLGTHFLKRFKKVINTA
jgi:hypothetical protein